MEISLVPATIIEFYLSFALEFAFLEVSTISHSFIVQSQLAISIMKLLIPKLALIDISIVIGYLSNNEMLIKLTFFDRSESVAYTLPLASAVLELPFIYLFKFDFTAVKPFDSVPKLSNILHCVRFEYSVTMDLLIFPFSHVVHSMPLLLLVQLQIFVLLAIGLGNRLIGILRQPQRVEKV